MPAIVRAAVRKMPTVETVVDRLDWCAGVLTLAALATLLALGRT